MKFTRNKFISVAFLIISYLLSSVCTFANQTSTEEVINLTISDLTDNSITISWETAIAKMVQINYGNTPALGSVAYDNRGKFTRAMTHCITITGLEPNTTYYYDIVMDGVVYDIGSKYLKITTLPVPKKQSEDSLKVESIKEITPSVIDKESYK